MRPPADTEKSVCPSEKHLLFYEKQYIIDLLKFQLHQKAKDSPGLPPFFVQLVNKKRIL